MPGKKVLNVSLMFLFIFLFFYSSVEAGQRIIALQSSRVKPYEDALESFKKTAGAKVHRFYLSDLKGKNIIREVRKTKPDMIVAIGVPALKEVQNIRDIPIVYFMVMYPETILAGENNISGVSINISQDHQLRTFILAMPYIKNIGILYDSEKTGHLVKRAKESARETGINLITKEVKSSKQVPPAIAEMADKIDAYWMFPDTTTVTPETLEFLFLFSMEKNIPVLTFSKKYVEMGALISVGIDPEDIGKQAGAMAKNILSDKRVRYDQVADARGTVVSVNQEAAARTIVAINQKVAGKLGVVLAKGVMEKARKVN